MSLSAPSRTFAVAVAVVLLAQWAGASEDAGTGAPAEPVEPAQLAAPESSTPPPAPDRWSIRVDSETYLRVFQRAPLPGPGGALVKTTTAAPLVEYAALRVDDLDVPWEPDSIDVELAAWGMVNLAEVGEDELRADGDLAVAFVRHRVGPAYFTLGRQVMAGGAARLARFDGLAMGIRAPFGLGADAYGGLTVLPRWSGRPGYHHLGSASDTLLRSPEALADPSRDGHWLVGGRLYYALESLGQLGASFHEQQQDGELGHRNLAFDLRATPHEAITASGQVILDVDSWLPSDARAAVDVYPLDELSFAAEYLHAVPALLLSRQSVLSVFSTDAFHELGGSVSARPIPMLLLGGGGHAQLFEDGEAGARLSAHARLAPLDADRLVVHAGYRWVTESANGYHAPRATVGFRVIDPLTLTAQLYLYVYDEPVRRPVASAPDDVLLSVTGATTAEWTFDESWAVLLGGSIGSTPYAALDLQGIARLRMNLAWGEP